MNEFLLDVIKAPSCMNKQFFFLKTPPFWLWAIFTLKYLKPFFVWLLVVCKLIYLCFIYNGKSLKIPLANEEWCGKGGKYVRLESNQLCINMLFYKIFKALMILCCLTMYLRIFWQTVSYLLCWISSINFFDCTKKELTVQV